MSLQIHAPTGLGEHTEQQIHDFWDTLDGSLVDVMRSGFMPVDRPNYAPPNLDPTQLDTLTPERYHLLSTQISSWKTYSQYILNNLKCGIEACEHELIVLGATIRKQMRAQALASGNKKPAEAVIDDEVLTNSRHIEVTRNRQMYYEHLKMVEPHDERYGRELRILSRALEMRRQELEANGLSESSGPRMGIRRSEIY